MCLGGQGGDLTDEKPVTAVQDNVSTFVSVTTQDILKVTTVQFPAFVVLTEQCFFFFSTSLVCGNQNGYFKPKNDLLQT